MLGAAFTAPAPELRSRYGPTGFYVVERQLVDERVELVLVGRRRSRIEAAAVAGKPEFLHHQRLAQALGDGHLAPEIVARVLLDRRPGADEILRVRPAPVLGPYMGRHVVDVRRRMRIAHAGVAVVTPHRSLAAGGHHVMGIECLDQPRGVVDPREIGRQVPRVHV